MNTCKTCKFWSHEPWGEDPPKGWAWCLMTRVHDGVETHPESLAKSEDAEFYRADLRTHETFGCNQWQAKP